MDTSQWKCKAGDRIWIVGDLYTFLITGAETDGAYALIDAQVSPGGGPPLHRHSREDEGFFIVDGEVEFTVDGETHTAHSGEFVNAPCGSLHSFRNISDKPAHMLFLLVPAGFENYFVEAGVQATGGEGENAPEQDMDKLLQCAEKYGLEFQMP